MNGTLGGNKVHDMGTGAMRKSQQEGRRVPNSIAKEVLGDISRCPPAHNGPSLVCAVHEARVGFSECPDTIRDI